MHIHFFANQEQDPGIEFLSWDPDSTPNLFCDGYGHSSIELAKRLEKRSHTVTFGVLVPRHADIVIFFKQHLAQGLRKSFRQIVISCMFPTVHIRSDLPRELPETIPCDVQVVPNLASIKEKNQVFLLHLPQRGLIKSGRSIHDPIQIVSVKSMPENLSCGLKELKENLRLLNPSVRLVLDVPHKENVNENSWHDFSGVDVSLIFRKITANEFSDTRKPATRLINAWIAESIPFVQPLECYLELIEEGENAFVVNHLREVIEKIRHLNENPHLLKEIRLGVFNAAKQISSDEILNQWEKLIIDAARENRPSPGRTLSIFFRIINLFLSRFKGKGFLR